MKVLEAIERVNKSPENMAYIDVESICNIVGFESYNLKLDSWRKIQEDIQSYWLSSWLCTDSIVGAAIYFLNGKPIMVSSQNGRKADINYEFISEETFSLLREYIYQYIEISTPKHFLIQPEDEVDDYYQIEFNSQFVSNHHRFGYLKDSMVEVEFNCDIRILRNYRLTSYSPKPKWHQIEDINGKVHNLEDIVFPIHTRKQNEQA